MLPHHRSAVETIVAKLSAADEVLGILVGGSIAHGFAGPSSDVDIMIVVSPEDYAARTDRGALTYWETESTPYDGGYVDGKYISEAFIREVAEHGSEPARFAFKDAIVAFSRVEGLEQLVTAAAAYPVAEKDTKLRSFRAQFEAWHWYCGEAFRQGNEYLRLHAVSSYVLFAGRIVLAENELLFPFHKWFIRVLGEASRKPDGFTECVDDVLRRRDPAAVEALYRAMDGFGPPVQPTWPVRFMLDTELAWLDGKPPIAEV